LRLITGFDHVVIAVRDLERAAADYAILLGSGAERTQRDGIARAIFTTSNCAVELMAPAGDGEGAERLRAALEGGEGLKSLVFAVGDLERMHRHAERVGLAPQPIIAAEHWSSFRADSASTRGLRIFFLQRHGAAGAAPADGVLGLDHVVIRTGAPDSAAALFGARLGLDLRLDREVMGRRLMFFRCGDAVLEVAHDPALDADVLWGLSWRVADASAAQARLSAAGFNVSDVRAGMKPGTRVFTVRDRTGGAPTLMVEASPNRD
jgi:catechol 2,3-dioxygenase-like lactoylglutathione lyase family enzyme